MSAAEEDEAATDVLVGNATNLLCSVRDLLRVARAASIRLRVDAGYRIRWIRRHPWR